MASTVLVIEDDPDIRGTLQQLLELEGYDVRTASDGAEGLAKLEVAPEPCLILLDMMMPGMNGWEFLEVRRQSDVLAAIPVVVVSAATGVENNPAFPREATGYIKKPVDLDVLMDRVRSICGAAA